MKIICSLVVVTVLLSGVQAEDTIYTAGFNVGTKGVGIDLSVPVAESFSIRGSLNGGSYSVDGIEEDIAYDASGDLLTIGVLVDYYPIESNQFRLSAGAFYNGNQINAHGKATGGTYEINDVVYDADEIGSLDADLGFNSIAPYIGLGWGYKGSTSGWGFSMDVGALYHGAPQVGMDVVRGSAIPPDNGGPNDQAFDSITSDVEAQRQTTEDDLSSFGFYPVLRLGVTYTF